MKLSEQMREYETGELDRWADKVALLEAELADANRLLLVAALKYKELEGKHCSICGQQPSVLIEGTYWKCHECIREDIMI